jgi:hypothetical protein
MPAFKSGNKHQRHLLHLYETNETMLSSSVSFHLKAHSTNEPKKFDVAFMNTEIILLKTDKNFLFE